MNVKERILTVRLIEKVLESPSHGAKLGILVKSDPGQASRESVNE